jgi:hypothetical protein
MSATQPTVASVRYAGAAIALALGLLPAAPAAAAVEIRVLSGRPDMVSGGDALIEIGGIGDVTGTAVRVTVNARDVTSAFRAAAAGPLRGHIDGLTPGRNSVDVRADGKLLARLVLTNYPITGPVFSGSHQTPFICQTEDAGLGPPVDAQCSASTAVVYLYRSTSPPTGAGAPAVGGTSTDRLPPAFRRYDLSGPRPADIDRTTTTEGRTVDYIVRRERGTINRAVYDIVFLHVPGEPLPDPWMRTPGWNGRLVYLFNGGCGAGYRQGDGANALIRAVSAGYAVATSSLNILQNTCNDVISAETMMMVKEHFIERFGPPAHTIGTGGSGGAIQQYLITQNYPGLLDGIIPEASYPDVATIAPGIVDCSLLARAFAGADVPWTIDQKAAVSGYHTWTTCTNGFMAPPASFSPDLVRATACPSIVPTDRVYAPATNRSGVRCSLYDNQATVYGRDATTGFGRRPLDNVGVQYGLAAFNQGIISTEQFLELNARVGGYDADGNLVSARTVADPAALRIAYATGRVNSGGGSLAVVPIIDSREYLDPTGDIHDAFRSFVTRARLLATNGRADNHVILRTPRGSSQPGQGAAAAVEVIRLMDQWLTDVSRDGSTDSMAVKVRRTKPAELADGCVTPQGERIVELVSYTSAGRCNQLYPLHGDPRIAAGAPLTNDILKCRLKAIDPRDYTRSLTAAQMAQLRAVFPTGVCDYRRPGVGQRRLSASWQRY